MDFTHIHEVSALTETDFALASRDCDCAYALLDHVAKTLRPARGEERILTFLARLALRCDEWLEGDLRVDIQPQSDGLVRLILLRGIGGDTYEFLKRITLDAAMPLFRRTTLDPNLILPFEVVRNEDELLRLFADMDRRRYFMPPPDYVQALAQLGEAAGMPFPQPPPNLSSVPPPPNPMDGPPSRPFPSVRFGPEAITQRAIRLSPVLAMPIRQVSSSSGVVVREADAEKTVAPKPPPAPSGDKAQRRGKPAARSRQQTMPDTPSTLRPKNRLNAAQDAAPPSDDDVDSNWS